MIQLIFLSFKDFDVVKDRNKVDCILRILFQKFSCEQVVLHLPASFHRGFHSLRPIDIT